jgi:two-component system NtrC family sensor kinase
MLVRHQAELAEVRLETHADAELPPIVCDGPQIQQMILAVLMNAIEASGPGDTVSIQATFDAPNDLLSLRISDTGSGIAPEYLPRIFEPFFTTKQEGAGVGLGLAVVYGIVHRHRGYCDVDSTPESGTIFTIWLPRQQPSEAAEDNP